MDFEDIEAVLQLIENWLNQTCRQGLEPHERLIMQGSWKGKTYEQMEIPGYALSTVKQIISPKLWKRLSTLIGQEVRKKNCRIVLEPILQDFHKQFQLKSNETQNDQLNEISTKKENMNRVSPKIDWGEASDTSGFVGRDDELAELKQWMIRERCGLITLLASGGMGKSALAQKCAEQNKQHFDSVIWRSLREAPPLDKIITDLIEHICPENINQIHETNENKINGLIEGLKNNRCLVILDNFEAIFEPNKWAGTHYKKGYQNYGYFLQRVCESRHQSCLLITSREKPHEVAISECDRVRSKEIKGLKEEAEKLLNDKYLLGTFAEKQKLITLYEGNPLALKIVASLIKDGYQGNIHKFLMRKIKSRISKIDDLLEEQYKRSTRSEKVILYWIAINREPVEIDVLENDILFSQILEELPEALTSLKRRSLIETSENIYTLQNVLMEYMTERLCQKISQEIQQSQLDKFDRYALLKATAKDYIRTTQQRLILQRIVEVLEEKLGNKKELIAHFRELIKTIRREKLTCYSAGNLINLLCFLEADLSHYDFSELTIRQAFLRDVELQEVNLQKSELKNCIFPEKIAQVWSLTLSRDGQILAGGDGIGNVHIWETNKRQKLYMLPAHQKRVRSIRLSPDQTTLITASLDKTVKFWDIHTGQLKRSIDINANYQFGVVMISPDCQMLATTHHYKGKVEIWDLNTGRSIRSFSSLKYLRAISFSPNNKLIISGDDDCNVMIWDINNGQLLGCFKESFSVVDTNNLGFKNSGEIFVGTSRRDHRIIIWDIHDLKNIKILASIPAHENQIRCVEFSSDRKMMASGSADKTVKLWDISDLNHPQLMTTLQGHSSWITALKFSPNRKTLISTSSDRTLRVWDIQNPYQTTCIETFRGYNAAIRGLIFSKDGKHLINCGEDKKFRVWNLTTGELLRSWRGHDERVTAVTLSPDGQIIASCSWDYQVKLWDFKTGQCLAILDGHTDQVYSVVFTVDQKSLISVGDDHTIKVWDLKTQECVKTWRPQLNQLFAIALHPDNQIIAVGAYKPLIQLLNFQTGQEITTLRGHEREIIGLAFSPDGQLLASSSQDNTVRLWDIKTGKQLKKFKGQQVWTYNVAFSPNGRFLAFGSVDNTLCLWDASTDQCYYLSDHNQNVLNVAFSPDSEMIASGNYDETIKIWDVDTLKCLRTFKIPLPYQGMKITGIQGLSPVKKQTLKALGAFE